MDHDREIPCCTSVSTIIETASRQLEALSNMTRLEIYRTLVRAGRSGLAVGQVQERLGLPASTLSHHLKRLTATGLVRQEREGTSLICHAEYPAMEALIGLLADECCADEAPGCRTGAGEVSDAAAT